VGSGADDSFAFVINDGRGGTAQGTAIVTVVPDEGIPENLQLESLPDGDVRLTIDGIPGRTYSVLFTEQLNPAAWQTLGTAVADGAGRFTYLDSPPPEASARYYRSAYP
jgi:hypothetical protein